MSFFSPVNQARWRAFATTVAATGRCGCFNSLSLQPGRRAAGQRSPAAGAVPGPAVRPGVKKLHRANLRRRVRHRRRLSGSGCSSSWRLTAGRYGRQCASARRQLILPARFPFHRRPRPATGSAPTPTAAMCWRGSSMGHASRCSSVCC